MQRNKIYRKFRTCPKSCKIFPVFAVIEKLENELCVLEGPKMLKHRYWSTKWKMYFKINWLFWLGICSWFSNIWVFCCFCNENNPVHGSINSPAACLNWYTEKLCIYTMYIIFAYVFNIFNININTVLYFIWNLFLVSTQAHFNKWLFSTSFLL